MVQVQGNQQATVLYRICQEGEEAAMMVLCFLMVSL